MNEYLTSHPNLDLNPGIKKQWWETLKAKSEKNRAVIQVRTIK